MFLKVVTLCFGSVLFNNPGHSDLTIGVKLDFGTWSTIATIAMLMFTRIAYTLNKPKKQRIAKEFRHEIHPGTGNRHKLE